jgi:hypothetical protein
VSHTDDDGAFLHAVASCPGRNVCQRSQAPRKVLKKRGK